MTPEEIDQLKTLLRKYFKSELEIWVTLERLSVEIQDEEPESIFLGPLTCKGKFSDGTEQLKRLWMDEILYCLLIDSENGKYER